MGTIVNDTRPIQASAGSRDGPGGSSDEIDGPLGAGGRDPRAGDGRRRRRRATGRRAARGEHRRGPDRGQRHVTTEQVRAKLLSRPGHPLDQRQVEADLKTLIATKWFSDVTPYYEPDPKGKGYILTFSVKEMPVLTHVEFRGRSKIKLKDIEETTGLKKGARADAARTRLAVGQIQRLYAEKGYDMAEVYLLEGGNRGDTRVVIQIFEGPWHKISRIEFEGNIFATDATLRTKITSKTTLLGLRGHYTATTSRRMSASSSNTTRARASSRSR